MSRTPLEIIEADQSYITYVRCDGEKIEEVTAHNGVMIRKTITIQQANEKTRAYADVVAQMLAKAERDRQA
ncbi:MAG: hypothetical protein V4564_07705 [Pseudomonadota bacterium]